MNDLTMVGSTDLLLFLFIKSKRVSENKSNGKSKYIKLRVKWRRSHAIIRQKGKTYWILQVGSIWYVKFIICNTYVKDQNEVLVSRIKGEKKVYTLDRIWLGLNNIDNDHTINSTSNIKFIRAIIPYDFFSFILSYAMHGCVSGKFHLKTLCVCCVPMFLA